MTGPRARRPPPSYLTPALELSEKERVEYAHKLWRARSDLLRLAPLVPAWSTRLLCHAKACVQMVDKLTPDPVPRGQPDDE